MKFRKNYQREPDDNTDVNAPGYCPWFFTHKVVPSTPLMKDGPRIYVNIPPHYDPKANDTDSDWDMLDYEAASEGTRTDRTKLGADIPNETVSALLDRPQAATPKEIVELRLSRPSVVTSFGQVNEEMDEMDIDSTSNTSTKPQSIPRRISHTLTKHTSLLPFSTHVFHCSNTWDLFLCLNRMTPTQRSVIKTLKIRWRDAQWINWEFIHQKTCTTTMKAYVMLTGLEVLIMDVDEQDKREVESVRRGVEKWIDNMLEGVEVKIEGETIVEPVPEPKVNKWQVRNKGKGKCNGNENGKKGRGKKKQKSEFFQSPGEGDGGSTKAIGGWDTHTAATIWNKPTWNFRGIPERGG